MPFHFETPSARFAFTSSDWEHQFRAISRTPHHPEVFVLRRFFACASVSRLGLAVCRSAGAASRPLTGSRMLTPQQRKRIHRTNPVKPYVKSGNLLQTLRDRKSSTGFYGTCRRAYDPADAPNEATPPAWLSQMVQLYFDGCSHPLNG